MAKKQTPYYVLVSEIMLQQTQVDRVVPFFKQWMKSFPSIKKLADSPQADVLKHWKGLGYNSRALRLQKCAQIIVQNYKGRIPKDYNQLLQLPGVGPYTAAAVMNFACDTWTPLIETNIRRIFIHHFFADQTDIPDTEIMNVIEQVGYYDSPRVWCAALMNYGSTLPKIVAHNPNTRSRYYTKQSVFKGSDREIRGKILDILLDKDDHKISQIKLFKELGSETERYKKIVIDLIKEGFIKENKKSLILR